jgi:hypothetical protein
MIEKINSLEKKAIINRIIIFETVVENEIMIDYVSFHFYENVEFALAVDSNRRKYRFYRFGEIGN